METTRRTRHGFNLKVLIVPCGMETPLINGFMRRMAVLIVPCGMETDFLYMPELTYLSINCTLRNGNLAQVLNVAPRAVVLIVPCGMETND